MVWSRCERQGATLIRKGKKELLVDLKARGLVVAPQVAIGDGALGFWKALDEAFPTTRHQRCWLHKTLNALDKFPKSMQPNAHKDLREIWLSPGRVACSSRSKTMARARIRQSRNACFSPFSRRNRTASAWDSPSADQSSKPMAGDCGQRRARPKEPMSASLNGGSARIALKNPLG